MITEIVLSYHHQSHFHYYLIIIIFNNSDIFFTVCNLLNSSIGVLSKCNIDCCEGSYCNTAVGISTSAVTSFVGAVLMAMFQNLFPTA